MIYLLDTNLLSDLIAGRENVSQKFRTLVEQDETLCLCQPVFYELRRGIFWRNSLGKYRIFNQNILPRLTLISLTDADWLQAAQLWADAVSRGKQLSDVDLLIAALTQRLDAVLVTGDDDFATLPIKRENWRNSQSLLTH